MPDGFKSLEDIIKKEPGLAGIRKIMNDSDVVAEFHNVFPDLKKIAKAVKVEKKTLFLKVENAAWRSELKFKEEIIVDKTNKFFKDKRINKIRFIS